jgi:nitrate/nitrite transporter NarK
MSQQDANSAITGSPPVATQTVIQISRRRVLAVYKQMLVSLFIATLVVMGVLVAFVLPFFISYYVKGQVDARDPPLLLIVVLAGALGAFFSVLMRLYNFEDLPKALVSPDLDGLPSDD